MASVSKCDCCGNVVNHEDCIYLKMFEENKSGKIGRLIHTIEMCTSCTDKFIKEFNFNGSE